MRAERITSGLVPRTYSTVVNAGGRSTRQQYRSPSRIPMASRPILVVTPATRFGSWAWIEKALAARPEQPAIVVGYGRSASASPNVRFVTLPAVIDYGAWSPRLAERKYLI